MARGAQREISPFAEWRWEVEFHEERKAACFQIGNQIKLLSYFGKRQPFLSQFSCHGHGNTSLVRLTLQPKADQINLRGNNKNLHGDQSRSVVSERVIESSENANKDE